MGDPLRFGLVALTEFPRGDDPGRRLREVESQVRTAEKRGLDSVWVGEHHAMDHPYFDNFQMLSYLAAVTTRVTLGTSICLAPLYNPVVLAERTANLDALSDGRFVFGAAVGYREKEFEVYGVDRRTRGAKLDESVDLLRRLWTEDDVTYQGKQFSFDDVSIHPKPVGSTPEVWLGGTAPGAVRRAAEKGDAWFVDPRISLSRLEKPAHFYDEYLDEAGRRPTTRPIWREVFVAETTDEARAQARPHLVNKYESYMSWGAEDAVGSDSLDHRFDELASDRFILGSPADVIDEIERYRSKLGIDHLLVRTRWPGMDVEPAQRSLRLFADEVVPHFRAD